MVSPGDVVVLVVVTVVRQVLLVAGSGVGGECLVCLLVCRDGRVCEVCLILGYREREVCLALLLLDVVTLTQVLFFWVWVCRVRQRVYEVVLVVVVVGLDVVYLRVPVYVRLVVV